jgi:hypothetical protein
MMVLALREHVTPQLRVMAAPMDMTNSSPMTGALLIGIWYPNIYKRKSMLCNFAHLSKTNQGNWVINLFMFSGDGWS